MKKSIYLDLVCGASGDMILASLIDMGVSVQYLQKEFDKLGLGITIGVEKLKRQGIEASHLILSWETQSSYRHLSQILEVIQSGGFSEKVIGRCSKVLDIIASAEAKVHGVGKEHVHFHEIGAVDTIIDVLGVSLSIEYLEVDELIFSQFTVGHGSVKTEHGMMPVPVPATAEMIRGYSVRSLDIATEILTPTGAGLLTALGNQVAGGSMEGQIKRSGYGCGDNELENHPNIIRCFLLEENGSLHGNMVCQVESDMDHISGEIMGHVGNELRARGVLDLVWIPVYMKKGRPGYRLSFLCRPEDRETLTEFLVLNSRTLGVRWQMLNRTCAERKSCDVTFRDNTVREKRCTFGEYSFSKLEYESLARLSEKSGVPILELIEEYNRDEK